MDTKDQANLELRVAKLERSERSLVLKAVISGFAAVVIAIAGNWLLFESGKQEREIKLLEIRAKHLDGMQGNYDARMHTLNVIAAVHGIGIALDLEPSFRSGATIRVLEQLYKDASKEHKNGISKSLSRVTRVLVIDSALMNNVYCELTKELAGTNIDDISDLIKDYPIRIAGRAVRNKATRKGLEDEVIKNKPNLIIMHIGAFEGVDYKIGEDEAEIIAVSKFVKTIISKLPDTEFLIYSRKGISALRKLRAEVAKEYPHKFEEIFLLPLKAECFKKKTNRERTRTAVRRVLQLDRLYTRTLAWPN